MLYLITDGEQTSYVTRRTFSSLRQYLNDGFTVGVGSTEGGKIPVIADGVSAGDSNTTDHWVVDPDTGEPGISKMDEKNLKDIGRRDQWHVCGRERFTDFGRIRFRPSRRSSGA